MDAKLTVRGHLHVCLQKMREFAAAESRVGVGDHLAATTTRQGRVIGISESVGRGRTAHADVNADGTISMGAIGLPVTNEKDTVPVCRTLVAALNANGSRWLEPEDVKERHLDAISRAVDPATTRDLRIQVVRGPADAGYYHALRKAGSHHGTATAPQCSCLLREAIELKLAKIACDERAPIDLVVNVREAPALALPVVVDAFRAEHGAWLDAQGFASVWVVGLLTNLVARLDESGDAL